jgi:hypothetical protein
MKRQKTVYRKEKKHQKQSSERANTAKAKGCGHVNFFFTEKDSKQFLGNFSASPF